MGNGSSSPFLGLPFPYFFSQKRLFSFLHPYNIYMKHSIFNFFHLLWTTCRLVLAASLILTTACLETGCSLPSGDSFEPAELLPGWKQETVTITLPDYPAESHPPLAGWKILYWNQDGGSTQYLSPGQQQVSITMEKNIPSAILCYPLTTVTGSSVSFFHPAGCVYPYSYRASWEEGFTAETFFQLTQSKSLEEIHSSPLLRFNWSRLTQQITKKIQQAQKKGTVFSPWFLQQELLKTHIQQGTASTRSIKQETLLQLERTELYQQELSQQEAPSNQLYYRYIPSGIVQETIYFPQTEGYSLHQENAFLQGNEIVSCFTKKNQKPVLVTIGIERYTYK